MGDTRLDWLGSEAEQGNYQGQPAEGTPLAWTSNSQSSPGYQALNTWGEHYWMVDVDMDCSQSEQGWFEVKAFLTNGGTDGSRMKSICNDTFSLPAGWESDISQTTCTGAAGGRAPYSSKNHLGRCGYVNVFEFGMGACQIIPLA